MLAAARTRVNLVFGNVGKCLLDGACDFSYYADTDYRTRAALNLALYPCLFHGISDMHPFNAPFRLGCLLRFFLLAVI